MLKDQCFVYLILNLEEFSIELPGPPAETYSKHLLLNLPIADICKLEETDVVEGVDMNAAWAAVRENRTTANLAELSIELPKLGGKEFCYRALTFVFVHSGVESTIQVMEFKQLLYSVKLSLPSSANNLNLVGLLCVYKRCHWYSLPNELVIPSRYVAESQVDGRCSEICLLQYHRAVLYFRRCPLWIDIDVDVLYGTLRWELICYR